MPQIEQKKWRAWFVLNRYSLRCSSPSMTRSPARGTDATTAPFLRQIEQSHRRGSSIPLGKASSSTTAPQWQEARCGLVILTPSISLITGTILLQHNAHGNGRSTWSDCSRNNAEGLRELERSVERPSEPQANVLTYLLWPFFLVASNTGPS